jgi:thiamine biosynthesis lipoprotein
MMADAWATALTVMGSTEALAMAEARDLAIYLITQSGDSTQAIASRGMQRYLLDNPQ